jgi:radical SAM superfamily enzyme YgiQ (UPF0313 family)
MEISLIDPSNGFLAIQGRLLSSYLKENGHKTKLVMLPVMLRQGWQSLEETPSYTSKVLDDLLGIVKSSDMIGLTVWTNFFVQCVEITRFLKKKLDVPVLWGGIHPTVRPRECLQYADIVCVGEGEDAMLELANRIDRGTSYHDIKNLWCKKDGGIVRNDVRPLQQYLDKYPPQDWELVEHYGSDAKRIWKLTADNIVHWVSLRSVRDYDGKVLPTYYTEYSRGCPFACTYCCNSSLHRIYRGKGPIIRRKSIPYFIDELTRVRKTHPFFHNVAIIDDCFMLGNDETVERFAQAYREKVGMPFRCITHPGIVTERKIGALVSAGLYGLEIGVESGSLRVKRQIYRRPDTNEDVLRAARIINKYRAHIVPRYDFILDNPWENEHEFLETVKLANELPRPYVRSTFSLTFFPGTDLYEKAKQEGLLRDDIRDVYLKSYVSQKWIANPKRMRYSRLLFHLSKSVSKSTMKKLTGKRLLQVANRKGLEPLFGLTYLSLTKRQFQPIMKLVHLVRRVEDPRKGYEKSFDA